MIAETSTFEKIKGFFQKLAHDFVKGQENELKLFEILMDKITPNVCLMRVSH